MKNKELVYLLTVKAAEQLAEKHNEEADWDLWSDPEALCQGLANQRIDQTTVEYDT